MYSLIHQKSTERPLGLALCRELGAQRRIRHELLLPGLLPAAHGALQSWLRPNSLALGASRLQGEKRRAHGQGAGHSWLRGGSHKVLRLTGEGGACERQVVSRMGWGQPDCEAPDLRLPKLGPLCHRHSPLPPAKILQR